MYVTCLKKVVPLPSNIRNFQNNNEAMADSKIVLQKQHENINISK